LSKKLYKVGLNGWEMALGDTTVGSTPIREIIKNGPLKKTTRTTTETEPYKQKKSETKYKIKRKLRIE
jgi:hypothetical protein